MVLSELLEMMETSNNSGDVVSIPIKVESVVLSAIMPRLPASSSKTMLNKTGFDSTIKPAGASSSKSFRPSPSESTVDSNPHFWDQYVFIFINSRSLKAELNTNNSAISPSKNSSVADGCLPMYLTEELESIEYDTELFSPT